MRQVEHAVHGEIERSGCLGAEVARTMKEGELFKNKPFKEWLDSRPLALRPICWEISSDAHFRFKMVYERDAGE